MMQDVCHSGTHGVAEDGCTHRTGHNNGGRLSLPPPVNTAVVTRDRVVLLASWKPYRAARIWLRRLTIWVNWPSTLPPLSKLAMLQSRLPSRLPGPDSAVKLMTNPVDVQLEAEQIQVDRPEHQIEQLARGLRLDPGLRPDPSCGQPRKRDWHRLRSCETRLLPFLPSLLTLPVTLTTATMLLPCCWNSWTLSFPRKR